MFAALAMPATFVIPVDLVADLWSWPISTVCFFVVDISAVWVLFFGLGLLAIN